MPSTILILRNSTSELDERRRAVSYELKSYIFFSRNQSLFGLRECRSLRVPVYMCVCMYVYVYVLCMRLCNCICERERTKYR